MSAPRKSTPPPIISWIPVVWTIGVGLVGFIGAGATFYVTTSGTLSAHNKSIDDLTRVLKEESLARATMEKNEAAKREELRKEYLGMMKDQTATFGTIGEKLTTVGTKVEVIGTKYEAVAESVKKIDDSIRKVIEQTAPVPATGSIPRYKR